MNSDRMGESALPKVTCATILWSDLVEMGFEMIRSVG